MLQFCDLSVSNFKPQSLHPEIFLQISNASVPQFRPTSQHSSIGYHTNKIFGIIKKNVLPNFKSCSNHYYQFVFAFSQCRVSVVQIKYHLLTLCSSAMCPFPGMGWHFLIYYQLIRRCMIKWGHLWRTAKVIEIHIFRHIEIKYLLFWCCCCSRTNYCLFPCDGHGIRFYWWNIDGNIISQLTYVSC